MQVLIASLLWMSRLRDAFAWLVLYTYFICPSRALNGIYHRHYHNHCHVECFHTNLLTIGLERPQPVLPSDNRFVAPGAGNFFPGEG